MPDLAKERNVNKKRETIRKPIDREAVPDWDDQERVVPPKAKKREHRSEEQDMILEKDDD